MFVWEAEHASGSIFIKKEIDKKYSKIKIIRNTLKPPTYLFFQQFLRQKAEQVQMVPSKIARLFRHEDALLGGSY